MGQVKEVRTHRFWIHWDPFLQRDVTEGEALHWPTAEQLHVSACSNVSHHAFLCQFCLTMSHFRQPKDLVRANAISVFQILPQQSISIGTEIAIDALECYSEI